MNKRENVTLDADVAALEKMEALALALKITRNTKNGETGNISNVIRLFVEFGRDRSDEFEGWYAARKSGTDGPRRSISFQDSSDTVAWLNGKAGELHILRLRDGREKPNVSEFVRLLIEFAFSDIALFKLWILEKIDEATE